MGLFDWIGPTSLTKRRGWDALPAVQTEQKLNGTINDFRAALTSTMLVSGPGATELLNGWRANDSNSAVYACLEAICSAYVEAPLTVYRQTSPKDREPLFDSPLQAFLDDPNPALDMLEILWWVQWAKHVDGNAYLRKIRAGNSETGNVVQVWPISPSRIEVKTLPGSGDFISYYRYWKTPSNYDDISPENMVHFRMGLDDRDHRLGCSPLKRLAREVSSDDAATAFADQLLKNYAVPGLVVEVDKESRLSKDDAEELKARISSAYGGENRGNVGVLTAGAKMHAMGWSPEQMNLHVLHTLPEERISSVLRVPAIVAGLGAGLQRSTFANFKEAREAFTEGTILSLYRADDKKLTTSLARDFTADTKIIIAHDISQMRALQDDENAKAARLKIYVDAGIMDTNEARAQIDLEPKAIEKPQPTIVTLPQPDDQDALPAPAKARKAVAAGDLGAPLLMSDSDLDGEAEVTDADMAAADRWWRKAVKGTGLEELFDAVPVGEGED